MLPGTHLVKADYLDTPSPTLQRRYCNIVGSIDCLVQMTWCDVAFAYGQLSLFKSCIPLSLSNWQPPNVLFRTCEALTNKACLIATLAPKPQRFDRVCLQWFCCWLWRTSQCHQIHHVPQWWSYQLAKLPPRGRHALLQWSWIRCCQRRHLTSPGTVHNDSPISVW